jgi:hypothetical protein
MIERKPSALCDLVRPRGRGSPLTDPKLPRFVQESLWSHSGGAVSASISMELRRRGDYPSNLPSRVLLLAALSGVLSPEQQERQLHVAVRAGRCRELAATDIVIPAGAADDRQSCQVRGALGAKRTELASVQA